MDDINRDALFSDHCVTIGNGGFHDLDELSGMCRTCGADIGDSYEED